MAKSILNFLICVAVANPAAASDGKTVLFQSEDVNSISYEAYLKTEPKYVSAIEHQLEQRPNQSRQKDLISAFDRAERSFLADTVEAAHANYKAVTKLALVSDWTTAERKLIFHCYLRAAQTAVTKEGRLALLEYAIRFDPALTPDEKLFPPPMVAEWRVRKSKVSNVTLQLPDSYKSYEAALLNGRRIDFKRFAIRVPEGDFRLTLLSNQFAPVSKVGSVEDFRKWRPESAAHVSGKCSNAKLYSPSPREAAALFSENCLARFNSKEVSPAIANQPAALSADLFTRNFRRNSEERTSDSVFQKPLFWGIAGSVVAFLAYSASRKNEPQPTHKTGF